MGLSTPDTKHLRASDDVFLLAGMTCPLVGRLADEAVLKDDGGLRIPRRAMSSVRMPREILGSAGFEPISDKGAFRFESELVSAVL
ncbi:hypothetical protein F4809DRAFT_645471 [Biscogniauxia mediterranea]|nr:hypothetical protein F4809DRAFT_645471 [Biscogniauxia mediterranea]